MKRKNLTPPLCKVYTGVHNKHDKEVKNIFTLSNLFP